MCANTFYTTKLNRGDPQLHFGGCLNLIRPLEVVLLQNEIRAEYVVDFFVFIHKGIDSLFHLWVQHFNYNKEIYHI